MTIPELLARLDGYGFTCEAGPLTNCVEWQALKARVFPQYKGAPIPEWFGHCQFAGHDPVVVSFTDTVGFSCDPCQRHEHTVRASSSRAALAPPDRTDT